MKCNQVQNVLSDYLDGELSAVQAGQVREHLDRCTSCDARWRMLRQTVRLVGHLGHERCPVDLRATVALAVQHRYAGKTWRFPMVPFLSVSGAAAALTGLVLGITLLKPAVEKATLPVPQATIVAEAPLHDQYDLATGLGTADGLLLALSADQKAEPHRQVEAERLRPAKKDN